MRARRVAVFVVVGLASGCGGGGGNGGPEPSLDGSADAVLPDSSGADAATRHDASSTSDASSRGDASATADGSGMGDATVDGATSDGGPSADSANADGTTPEGGDAATGVDAATGGDSATDGAAFDGNLACTGTNTACRFETDAGTLLDGLCASSTCSACVTKTDDSLCNAAYGDGGSTYICANSSCVPGDCHTDTDCAGSTVACVGNSCVACDGASAGVYYVDPTGGSDASTSTGSDSAGGQARAQCAFKTLTHALSVVGTPSTSTKIVVLGTAIVSAGETFPLNVPANVVIEGQGGAVTIRVPAQTTTDAGASAAEGFVLAHPSSGLESLTIDGQSLAGAAGVLVTSGSAASTYMKNVVVQNFASGDGVEVTGSGVVTLDEGVALTKNLVGLSLSGTGNAASTNANTTNPVAFTHNTQDGVLVAGTASVSFAGTAGTFGAGSIVASNNASGFAFAQDGPGANMPASSLTGVVAWQNTANGLDVEGGSRVMLRSSYVGANATGVNVRTSTRASNDTSYVDLGSSSDLGKNTLQSLASSDGGASAQNTNAALCYSILPNSSQTLLAIGNLWVNAANTTAIDCSATSPGQLSESVGCAGAVDVGGAGVQLAGGAGKNTVDVNNCSL